MAQGDSDLQSRSWLNLVAVVDGEGGKDEKTMKRTKELNSGVAISERVATAAGLGCR